MSENVENVAGETAKRPVFLTVLCILTFVGSLWGILSSLFNQDEALNNYAAYYYWVLIILNLMTAYGAFQMLKLKKTGLYIWTFAELAALVLTWVVIKGYVASTMTPVVTSDMEGSQAMLEVGTSMVAAAMNTVLIVASVFPAIFILLYWLNAKHLK